MGDTVEVSMNLGVAPPSILNIYLYKRNVKKEDLVMETYTMTPLQASNAKNILLRKAWPLVVKFNYKPPSSNNKSFRPYRKLKKHIEEEIKYLTVLDDFELYRILQEIKNNNVAPFWKSVVTEFWLAKKNNQIVNTIQLGNGESLELWIQDRK